MDDLHELFSQINQKLNHYQRTNDQLMAELHERIEELNDVILES